MKERSLMQRFIDAGMTKEEMFHYHSDLYVFVTPLTRKIVNEYCREFGYDVGWMCPVFRSLIDGRMMYDCAFSYEPELMELGT